MADYAISNVPRRVVYAASGVGPYAFTFEILVNTDVAVYRDDTLLTLTTDYTVSIAANGTGTVTLVATPTGATQIAIVGSRAIQRTSDFVTGGDFFANTVNDELDSLTIFAQQNAEAVARALQAPQTDPTNINMTLPRAADRANKYLAFDEDGNPKPGDTAIEIATVAAIADEVAIVADNIASVNTNATNIVAIQNASANAIAAASSADSSSSSAASAAASFDSFDDRYLGVKTTNPTLDNDGNALLTGALYWNSSADQLRVWTGTIWVQAAPQQAVGTQEFTATAGQTSFTVTGGYNTESVYVYQNGVLLDAADYTATSGTSVVLASAAALNDVVRVVTFFSPVDTVSIRDAAATSAASAATSASSAQTNATSASASATTALGAIAPVTSTSSTSLSIGTGSRSLTVETGKQWVPGMPIRLSVTASPATNFITGTVISYNSGTGALVVDVAEATGSGTYTAWSISLMPAAGSLATKLLRFKYLYSGTTYTPASDVSAFYAQVYGATGGANGADKGGIGGPGYSEKYYSAPSGSYTYFIGAAGSTSGTAGGTSSFGGAITVIGSSGVTTGTGSSGGSALGGDFNANGGNGGDWSGSSGGYGGCGGAGSRAGNGGNGGLGFLGTPGGQGGTGGNNASGIGTDGIGASTVSGSALVMPWGGASEVFLSGRPLGLGGAGAIGVPVLNNDLAAKYGYRQAGDFPLIAPIFNPLVPYPFARYINSAINGNSALIVIIEVLK